MSVWRFPLFAAANLIVLAILLPVVTALVELRSKRTTERARVVFATALALCVVSSP